MVINHLLTGMILQVGPLEDSNDRKKKHHLLSQELVTLQQRADKAHVGRQLGDHRHFAGFSRTKWWLVVGDWKRGGF